MNAPAPLARPLDPNLFLIGCGPDAPTGHESARSMGSKAYNLLRMARLGLRVPPAFVIGTAYCPPGTASEPAHAPAAVADAFWQTALAELETARGLVLGDTRRPLLLSVRSGAAISMPGMMETLLNVGLTDQTLPGLLRSTGNPRLAWDAYRRLVATYGEVVAGLDAAVFESETLALFGSRDERELDFAELRELTQRHLATYEREAGRPFPQDAHTQLREAIAAVFASWQAPKAVEYRRLNGIPHDLGTAVTVQSMVFGNAGGRSGAGVGFTRDPSSGEPRPWVDFLFNAQGEDVVSGRRSAHGHAALADALPAVWAELLHATRELEHAFGDMQDFEFTVQDGVLYLLQTRSGKRTPQAAARIALDLLDAGLIDPATARERTAALTPQSLRTRRVVAVDGQVLKPAGHAASASSGVAIGEIALDAERAHARHAAGQPVVLVRRDAETSDLAALEAAVGLLTQRGARTSHAAVVARQLGKVCLVGCDALVIEESARRLRLGTTVLHEGELLTLDGHSGCIYLGEARTIDDEPRELLQRLAMLREPQEPPCP